MRSVALCAAVALVVGSTPMTSAGCRSHEPRARPMPADVALPAPRSSGSTSLEAALAARRSVRSFSEAQVDLADLGQLLFAAQGITDATSGLRSAPSAGALFPLEVYVATADGVHRYVPSGHRLERVLSRDVRSDLARVSLGQDAVGQAPVVFVVVGVVARTRAKYGARAERYVAIEAGHAVQNLLLQATVLGLGAVPIGAFEDDPLRALLGIPADHLPQYVVPVGHPRG